MRSISIKSRLMLMLLIVSIASCSVLIYIGFQSGKDAITGTIFNELKGIRAAKQQGIESYFDHLYQVVEVISKNKDTEAAVSEFKSGFQKLGRKKINTECSEQLTSYYEGFVNRLSKNLKIEQSIDIYYPESAAACYLQYEYIIDNSNEIGKKHLMFNAGDDSDYTDAHRRHHGFFSEVVEKFGFYDLFLIDIETGDIVYSVFKEADFATNLYSGPYRKSNLATLVRNLNRKADIDSPQIIDFDAYRPSYGKPAAFIGFPVRRNNIPIGALIVQVPVDEVNNIMTDDNNWARNGLGESGETYLVGPDNLMRSISRFYLQDTLQFRKNLIEYGTDEEAVDKMYAIGSTILHQKVNNDGVHEALLGKTSTEIIEDYRGKDVLCSYSKLKMDELDWAILSSIDVDEAFLPIEDFTRKVFTSFCVVILIITFLSIFLSARFLRPIELLTEGVRKLGKGDYDYRINLKSGGEFGELAQNFNQMMSQLSLQQTTIETKTQENERLISNFLPKPIIKRVKKGEQSIASKVSNVTILVIDIMGFSEHSGQVNAKKSVALLNELVEALDIAARKHHIEKIRTVGDTYFAACGLHTPVLDHVKRMVDFAINARQIIKGFNINNNLDFHIRCCLHSGEVIAGVVGTQSFNYVMWGPTVTQLFRMASIRIPDSIFVSESVFEKVEENFSFTKVDDIPEASKLDIGMYQLIEKENSPIQDFQPVKTLEND